MSVRRRTFTRDWSESGTSILAFFTGRRVVASRRTCVERSGSARPLLKSTSRAESNAPRGPSPRKLFLRPPGGGESEDLRRLPPRLSAHGGSKSGSATLQLLSDSSPSKLHLPSGLLLLRSYPPRPPPGGGGPEGPRLSSLPPPPLGPSSNPRSHPGPPGGPISLLSLSSYIGLRSLSSRPPPPRGGGGPRWSRGGGGPSKSP